MSADVDLALIIRRAVCQTAVSEPGCLAAADAILAAGWRPPARVVTTAEERDALPAGVVVHAAGGTMACRHHSGVGVVFGDERPFPWDVLALPLAVLHECGESP